MKLNLFSCVALSIWMLLGTNLHAQQRTCGTDQLMLELLQDPDYQRRHQARLRQAQLRAEQSVETRAGCSATVIIPVAVHYQRLKRNQINEQCLIDQALDQIRILNEDYQGTNVDISNWTGSASAYFPGVSNGEACIEFCLATKSHPGGYGLNDGDYAVTFNQTNGDRSTDWSGYVNIFVRSINYLGYSPLGGNGDGDGVVIDNNAFGSGSGCPGVNPGAPYNLGRTLTHELGHYLLLDHIWGNGCSVDDGVADTPDQASEYYSCPALGSQSCGSNDMHMSYMDYTHDACMYMFSAGQAGRMENYINDNLANVVAKGQQVCNGGGPTPTCDDGVQNGNETGVDCGGPDCPGCPTASCDAPAGLSHQSKKGGKQAQLSWNGVAAANAYEVQIRPAGGAWPAAGNIRTSTNITYNVTKNNSYDWRVRSLCDNNEESAWAERSFTAGTSNRLADHTDEWSLFPNPADQTLQVILEIAQMEEGVKEMSVVEEEAVQGHPLQLNVLNIQGRVIFEQQVDNFSTFELNAADWAPGMYFLRISIEDRWMVKKFVVRH